MRYALAIYLTACMSVSVTGAQDPSKPVMRKGVSVQMAVAPHAVEMRAADEEDATVVAITAEGKVYVGVQPADTAALGKLKAGTVYVKADARVPYQNVLTVLDALRGRPVVLLTASPKNAPKGQIVPPYGVKLTVAR
jgi:hypothetical protein